MTKTVLITGTSSGFGLQAAELLAGKGYRVHAVMRAISGRHAAEARRQSETLGVTVHEADLADTAAIDRAVTTMVEKEGRIDVLVNNAGFFALGIAESFTEADHAHIYDINVMGPWRFIRAAMPHFRRQQEGLIVTVSSSLGVFSAPFMTAYSSAKHALEGLLEGMRYEVRPLGIDIAMIEPGIFPTHIWDHPMLGSDGGVAPGYGPMAGVADQILATARALFESGGAADPRLVAAAMLALIEMPRGTRPLRTPVDPAAAAFTLRANAAQAEEYAKFLRASGMGDLLE